MKNKLLLFLLQIYLPINCYNQLHVEILKQLIKNKKTVNISRCDFRGAGNLLKAINVSNGQVSGATFAMPTAQSNVGGIISIPNQKTDLTNANFSNCMAISTDFSNTILKNAKFIGTDIQYSNFSNADLTGAKFTNVKNAEFATFCGAIMPDGSTCNGQSWTNKSKTVTLYCNCPKKSSN